VAHPQAVGKPVRPLYLPKKPISGGLAVPYD
jgi:hypothetical protein